MEDTFSSMSASSQPSSSALSLRSFLPTITIYTTRLDRGDDAGAALFLIDVSVSNTLENFGSYNILTSSLSTDFISLTTTKGSAWSGNPIGLLSVPSGYTMIVETVGKKSTSYIEYAVSDAGIVSKKGLKLTPIQLVGKEAEYNSDLNQDGEIGFLPSGGRVDYGAGVDPIFAIPEVGYGILSEGSNYLAPLTTTKGSAWSGNPIGLLSVPSGYTMIVETVGKKSTSYIEYAVSDAGIVSKKGLKLTPIQLVGKEAEYNSDLNQDGEIGLLPAGTRVDYGSGATEVYKIFGVGHGILADGSTYLTPLTTSKGKAWVGDPIGVNGTSMGYGIITETVGRKSTVYKEYDVSSDGVVAKKGFKLNFKDLIDLESIYNSDFDQDGMSGLTPVRAVEPVLIPIFGNAVKGPLHNAVVFADEDGDGRQGPGEASTTTNVGGYFILNTSSSKTKIVVKTGLNTIDTSSGKVLSGVTLSAPPGSSVISPASTILEAHPDIKPEQLAIALGVPTAAADGSPIDLLNFNPFGIDSDPAAALAVEKAGQQVMVTVQAVSAAAEGAGMSSENAFQQAMDSVSKVVSAAAVTIDVSSPEAIFAAENATVAGKGSKIDLSNDTFLDMVSEEVRTKIAEAVSADKTITIDEIAFASVLDPTMTAVSNVVSAIEAITDTNLNSSASKGIFSTLAEISSEIKLAAEAEVVEPGGADALITFTDALAVSSAADTAAAEIKAKADYPDEEKLTDVEVNIKPQIELADDETDLKTENESDVVAEVVTTASTSDSGNGGYNSSGEQTIRLTDRLVGSFNDDKKSITISGLDIDLVSSELSVEILDNSLSPSDENYSFSITPVIKIVGDGSAIISYNDLNRSIQDLAAKNKTINFDKYQNMKLQYSKNERMIEIDGEGTVAIDPSVFEILDVSSKVKANNSVSVELRSELGWDYSASDIELATIQINFNLSEVNFINADLEGVLAAYNDTSFGDVGRVEAGMAQFGDVYTQDGGLFGAFNFIKTIDTYTKLEIEVYEIGSTIVYDYPVGFTFEI